MTVETVRSGIDLSHVESAVRPQDDLFRHVNGRWLARTEIPADRARDGAFRILAEEAENAVREIVEEAASAPEGSEERKFGGPEISAIRRPSDRWASSSASSIVLMRAP